MPSRVLAAIEAKKSSRVIANLASDPAQCLQMGWRGRELVERDFDRRAHAARYLELLQSL